jgi:hypothetical protein
VNGIFARVAKLSRRFRFLFRQSVIAVLFDAFANDPLIETQVGFKSIEFGCPASMKRFEIGHSGSVSVLEVGWVDHLPRQVMALDGRTPAEEVFN